MCNNLREMSLVLLRITSIEMRPRREQLENLIPCLII